MSVFLFEIGCRFKMVIGGKDAIGTVIAREGVFDKRYNMYICHVRVIGENEREVERLMNQWQLARLPRLEDNVTKEVI